MLEYQLKTGDLVRCLRILALSFLSACSALKKDNEPKDATPLDGVQARVELYRAGVKAGLDSHGAAVMGGSVGDSLLFSCLARVGGAADFDPAIFIRSGQPVRHPDIAPSETPSASGGRGTPISKDMLDGLQWCIWDVGRKGDKPHALELAQAVISFGLAHKAGVAGWFFCTEDDKVNYAIDDADWFGKCIATPSTVKDFYRLAIWAGGSCDTECRAWLAVGTNVPSDNTDFRRHLAVITTVRNGYADGAINDNSLKIVLENAARAEPRNGLYQGAFHSFGDGDQTAAWSALDDERLFPRDALPTGANYCTEYLFQRDTVKGDSPNGDWLPCDGDFPAGARGRGIDFLFAWAVASGEARRSE